MATRKKSTRKRELIAPRGDKRYVRRTEQGRFDESDDQGSSLSQDRRKRAKSSAAAGQGDRGDRRSAAAGKKSSRKKSTRKKSTRKKSSKKQNRQQRASKKK
jgi:hypothetical protein